jgi:hypothetical protein
MTDSTRKNIITYLNSSTSDPWLLDHRWDSDINQKMQQWITEYFIPKPGNQWLSWYRRDIASVWQVFQEWVVCSRTPFDLRHIRSETLSAFESSLPSLGWSGSAIYYVEILLIRFRQYLHKLTLLRCRGHTAWEVNFIEANLWINPGDFRTIREKIMAEGNDYEQVYFELVSLHPSFRYNILELKGLHIAFRSGRAFITFAQGNSSQLKTIFPCPSPVTQKLLLLLRRRNILADEWVFQPSVKHPLVRPYLFHRRIAGICMVANIPSFAQDSIYGFFDHYINRLIPADPNGEDIPSFACCRRFPPSKKNLVIIDEAYNQLVNGKEPTLPPYIPHPFFEWNSESLYDKENAQYPTL